MAARQSSADAGETAMFHRAVRATWLVLLPVTLVAGCTQATESASPDAGGTFQATPGQLSSAAPAAPPTSLNPTLLAGLDTGMEIDQSPATEATSPAYVTWPVVTGAPVLNASVVTTAATLRTGGSVPGGAAQRTVGWSLVAVSPATVGVRQFGALRGATAQRSRLVTTWYDVKAQQTHPSIDLINPTDQVYLCQEIARQVSARTGLSDSAAREAVTPETLTSLGFDGATGDLIVEFSAGALTGVPQNVSLRVQNSVAERWLSSLGRSGLAATRQPRALSVDSDTPEPTATAVSRAGKPAAVNCAAVKCVALVFAGGPTASTRQVLRSLGAAKVNATFFPVGQQADMFRDIVAEEIASGHQVGNGTQTFQRLPGLSGAVDEVRDSQQALREIGPVSNWLLPPFGATDASVLRNAGGPVLIPAVDSRDWQQNVVPGQVSARVVKQARRGSTVLLHDGLPTTDAALPAIISGLRAKGYRLVTVDQLFAATKPVAGRSYSTAG